MWHEDNRKCDGQLRHPTDSLQWNKIDKRNFEFGKESINLTLELTTNRINPFWNFKY